MFPSDFLKLYCLNLFVNADMIYLLSTLLFKYIAKDCDFNKSFPTKSYVILFYFHDFCNYHLSKDVVFLKLIVHFVSIKR